MNDILSYALAGFSIGVAVTTILYILVDRLITKEKREEAEMLRHTLHDIYEIRRRGK